MNFIFFAFLKSFSVFIVAGNGIIIYKTRQRLRIRQYIVASDQRNSSVTAMLLLLSIVIIICTGPGAIYFPLVFPKIYHEANDKDQIPVAMFLYRIFNCLAGLNASLNFLLYFLSGSKFRKKVKLFFTCRNNPKVKVFCNGSPLLITGHFNWHCKQDGAFYHSYYHCSEYLFTNHALVKMKRLLFLGPIVYCVIIYSASTKSCQ